MNTQLSFDLPARAALGRDDFFISPSNQIAVSMIDKWTQWSSRKLLLSGPEGAGKTHLTHVWATQSGATIIDATDLCEDAVPNLSTGPVAVENIHIIAGCEAQQTALFYLHNLCLETGQSILFTGRGEPQHWLLTLPDLESRLRGTCATPYTDRRPGRQAKSQSGGQAACPNLPEPAQACLPNVHKHA